MVYHAACFIVKFGGVVFSKALFDPVGAVVDAYTVASSALVGDAVKISYHILDRVDLGYAVLWREVKSLKHTTRIVGDILLWIWDDTLVDVGSLSFGCCDFKIYDSGVVVGPHLIDCDRLVSVVGLIVLFGSFVCVLKSSLLQWQQEKEHVVSCL